MSQTFLNASESYFSLDDILATQESVPCKVEVPIYRLGKFRQEKQKCLKVFTNDIQCIRSHC